ncbi:MAG: polysaccharide biosynthesis/export family protein [Vicinamibacteria bacterium]
MNGGRRDAIASVLGLLLAASSASAQAPARRTPEAPRRPAAAPTATPTLAAPARSPNDYEVGVQDILKVAVYGHDDLTQTVVVQADGTFLFPLVGRVKASNHTTAELERKLQTLLSQGYIRNPQVTVSVQEYRSKNVYVVGEVSKPGPYPLTGAMNILELVSKAGLAAGTSVGEVLIVRPHAAVSGPTLPTEKDGQADVIKVDLSRIQAGDISNNVSLRPNDTVFVPPAPKVFVSGEVKNPGAYAFFPGMTARQLVSVAGGLTPQGSSGRLKVVRDEDGKPKEHGIKLDEAVEPGDTLVVRRKLF